MIEALDIHVTGIVQGVGFRPFVYRLAKKYDMRGWVFNAVDGVHVRAEGDSDALDQFILEISNNAPAAAQVKQIDMAEVPVEGLDAFAIRESDQCGDQQTTLVSPDLGICDECVRELLDPDNRRFRYPFINCTNCGPRFTVIDALPYDRPNTAMAAFEMCPECAQEYADPDDRRFHAQPDACWDCGPKISLAAAGSDEVAWGSTREGSDEILAKVVALLKDGSIAAVKGLGGFHLCCDADNAEAVSRLRQAKHRSEKPFAVMVDSVERARSVCEVSAEEQKLLESAQKPIVLLRKKQNADGGLCIGQGIADGLPELGVMLPCTPLQVLLMHDFVLLGGRMLVMTSGNVSDEPIQTDDAEARKAFAGIADIIVGNDRPILSRFDDSVARVLDFGAGQTAVQMIRRARGFVTNSNL